MAYCQVVLCAWLSRASVTIIKSYKGHFENSWLSSMLVNRVMKRTVLAEPTAKPTALDI